MRLWWLAVTPAAASELIALVIIAASSAEQAVVEACRRGLLPTCVRVLVCEVEDVPFDAVPARFRDRLLVPETMTVLEELLAARGLRAGFDQPQRGSGTRFHWPEVQRMQAAAAEELR